MFFLQFVNLLFVLVKHLIELWLLPLLAKPSTFVVGQFLRFGFQLLSLSYQLIAFLLQNPFLFVGLVGAQGLGFFNEEGDEVVGNKEKADGSVEC